MQFNPINCDPNWEDYYPCKCDIECNTEAACDFRNQWEDCTRKGLEALCRITKNPFVKCIITCVIRFGDTAYRSVDCASRDSK